METERSLCWCCGGSNIPKPHLLREMMYGTREPFLYLECRECGSIRIKDIPKNLGDYYPANYYSFCDNANVVHANIHRLRSFLRSQRSDYMMENTSPLGWILNKVAPDYFPYPWAWFRDTRCNTGSPILDIGCGRGNLLRTMRMHGFTKLWGVDPFLSQSIYLKGLTIESKDLFEIKGSFHLVMSHHSLEHMPNPIRFLNAMKSLCRMNGYILIRLPVLSASWDTYGRDWVELDTPRHLWIPTIDGIKRLIKRVGGLRIKKVSFDTSDFEFYQSEMYLKDIPIFSSFGKKINPNEVFSEEEMKIFRNRAIEYNSRGEAGRAVLVIQRDDS